MELALASLLIADDHRMFNDALTGMLRPLARAVWQTFDGRELCHAIQQCSPDVVLLDINLPHLNGLEAAKIIRQQWPGLKVMLLTMYNHAHFVKEAKVLNLNGYLLKDSPSRTLFDGIDAVLAGQTFFDPKLRQPPTTADDAFVKGFVLTRREKEIIRGLVAGNSAEQVADQLCISYETVKSHRKNIYLKLGINNVVDLVRISQEQGWPE